MHGKRQSALLSPLQIRDTVFKNRIVISPMQQYAATVDGKVGPWHRAHLGRLAAGGAGLVFAEVTAVSPEGRNTYADTGLWSDDQIDGWSRLTEEMAATSIPGIQIGHCGRKASIQRPWDGFGPLTEADAARGEAPWPVVGPSAIASNPGWPVPAELTLDQIKVLVDQFASATRRALAAGFQALNIHGAHGYLIHSFLSPLSNQRSDAYGGDRAGRMRFALEVAEAVRANWPGTLPIFFRISAIDGLPGGWEIEDSIALARALKTRGIDVMDCSSGGLTARSTTAAVPRPEGYQVPLAAAVRDGADIATMAVGLIRNPSFAEAVVAEGSADFVAIGRESLNDPFWPFRAAVDLMGEAEGYAAWPKRYGWWLERRAEQLRLDPSASAPQPKAKASQ
ncbi:2,4-dienoyl-CoA reductase-like NADH-dependent reductase (Old Yellow Enzyme family) [Rhodoligotrophos appendicifer]|uniref:NADH:flavin oxidoreductase/NADH oxidase n=1 Tax=Rhodoligotrophos appendicifer TaxID=987056 RepID=UPI001185A2A7|nr:NADH:flavin oxidoreductase/NADH oxidase [Rhodoligotrophos appendicifer]